MYELKVKSTVVNKPINRPNPNITTIKINIPEIHSILIMSDKYPHNAQIGIPNKYILTKAKISFGSLPLKGL